MYTSFKNEFIKTVDIQPNENTSMTHTAYVHIYYMYELTDRIALQHLVQTSLDDFSRR